MGSARGSRHGIWHLRRPTHQLRFGGGLNEVHRNKLQAVVGAVRVVTPMDTSVSSMSTPEPKKGEKPSGSAHRGMGGVSETVLPMNTGTIDLFAIGDGNPPASQSPDATLSQFLQDQGD